MKYEKVCTITETIFVTPENLPDLKPGDIFTNSIYKIAPEQIIYDGGIDFRHIGYPVKQAQKKGRFLIDTGKGLYQYAYRPIKEA